MKKPLFLAFLAMSAISSCRSTEPGSQGESTVESDRNGLLSSFLVELTMGANAEACKLEVAKVSGVRSVSIKSPENRKDKIGAFISCKGPSTAAESIRKIKNCISSVQELVRQQVK